MKIESNFKDYYDVVMGEGIDLTSIYRRYPEEEILPHNPFGESFSEGLGFRSEQRFSYKNYTIGFCDKIYKCLAVTPREFLNNPKQERENTRFVYNVDDMNEAVKEFYPKYYEEYKLSKSFGFKFYSYYERQWHFEQIFENNGSKVKENKEKYFTTKRCPIFVVKRTNNNKDVRFEAEITYNSPLKQLNFMKIFSNYEAFQEISMWLNNQAIPIMPAPPIDDKTMAEIKGFDSFSFRKERTSKKWKNRKN